MTELLTIPQASRRLGMDRRGRKLKRLILGAEKRTKKRFAIRLKGPEREALRITWAALQRHLPELFGGGGLAAMERTLHGYMRATDRRMEETAEAVCRRVIAPVKRELEERDERVAQMVLDVGQRVTQLADRVAHHTEDGTASKAPKTKYQKPSQALASPSNRIET